MSAKTKTRTPKAKNQKKNRGVVCAEKGGS